MTPQLLKQIVPNITVKNAETYAPLLRAAFIKYAINTEERVCCFLAQTAHESGSFRYTQEIASGVAYEGREDLGNTQPGDGVKFKGRGIMQVTGRYNYEQCSLFIFKDKRLIDKPEILEAPNYAVDGAVWFWHSKKLNDICDKPDDWTNTWRGKTYNRFQWLTVRINGGLNGLIDRYQYYERAKEAFRNKEYMEYFSKLKPRGIE
jgi:putative chitinase